jgi:hypothetical protein
MMLRMCMELIAVTRKCRTAIMWIIWWKGIFTTRMAAIATIMVQ